MALPRPLAASIRCRKPPRKVAGGSDHQFHSCVLDHSSCHERARQIAIITTAVIRTGAVRPPSRPALRIFPWELR